MVTFQYIDGADIDSNAWLLTCGNWCMALILAFHYPETYRFLSSIVARQGLKTFEFSTQMVLTAWLQPCNDLNK